MPKKICSFMILLHLLGSFLPPPSVASSVTPSDFTYLSYAQTSILWRDPVDLESRNLFWGIGGQENAPTNANSFSPVNIPGSGITEKFVQDDRGRVWSVTFGPEAKADVAASRLLWAVGFHTSQNYYLASANLGGSIKSDVRFKRRNDGNTILGGWVWTLNPFTNSRELQGLKTMMALLSHWDLEDERNLRARSETGTDFIYYVSNLNKTLGKNVKLESNCTAANAADYSEQQFIDGIKDGKVRFHQKRFSSVVKDVTVENAKSFGTLLNRLSDKQIGDAFRAGGFSDAEVSTYVKAVRSRIQALIQLGQ